jgi:hypothetical protein
LLLTSAFTAKVRTVPGSTIKGSRHVSTTAPAWECLWRGKRPGIGSPPRVCGMWRSSVPTAQRTFSKLHPAEVVSVTISVVSEFATFTFPTTIASSVRSGTSRAWPTGAEESVLQAIGMSARTTARIAGNLILHPLFS